tara:strand:+ start:385 stop:501 length:117 start_codon:yes stop_codon:yes gene_type:complete
MDYNSISTEEFSEPLIGLGVNIIVKSPEQTAQILRDRF